MDIYLIENLFYTFPKREQLHLEYHLTLLDSRNILNKVNFW